MANQDDSSSEETAAAAAATAAAALSASQVGNSPFVKPAVPPRPRSILSDPSGKKHNNLNNVMNAKNSRNPVAAAPGGSSNSNSVGEQYAMDLMPSREADLSNEKCKRGFCGVYLKDKLNHFVSPSVTPQLCSGIINQLRVTIQSVLQLHERLREESGSGGGGGGGTASAVEADDGDSNNFLTMRSELENAVMMTQNMLTNITNNNNSGQNGDNR